jgi:multidrug efflux pump subunit AcrA (membrane-fusion protein)
LCATSRCFCRQQTLGLRESSALDPDSTDGATLFFGAMTGTSWYAVLARLFHTWGRDSVLVKKGWVTQQQGDTDRLSYAAQQQAKQLNDAAIQSQEAQLLVLRQQKAYQQVVAPFDGVVTQGNIDVGSLVQADATSDTFMFALTQSDVMRIRLYVPQDAAIGVKPGVDAVVRVPEIPDHTFRARSRGSPMPSIPPPGP